MQLIIVESPTKAKTLSRFLDKEFDVVPTMGHVRDLPKSKLGVDIEHDFEPQYVVIAKREKTISEIKGEAGGAQGIYLATDPDREGEAIAYHVYDILRSNLKFKIKNLKLSRIVFHEITESAVKEAIAHPREIDMNLVDAQQARRVLDRIVGYKLSPLLWRKVRRGLSAGRVQSVAVRLIVEREREIEKFKEEGYWRIFGAFKTKTADEVFVAELVSKNGESFSLIQKYKLFAGEYTVSKTKIKKEAGAQDLILDFGSDFTVGTIDKKEVSRHAPAPFTTSTLQQTANRRLGMSARQTMRLAQHLYEQGLITYHRTDSTALAKVAVDGLRKYIKDNYGRAYVPKAPNFYKPKSKVAQEAHEAIRPTDVGELQTQSSKLKAQNSSEQKLYRLIWERAVASQVAAARVEDTRVKIVTDNGYLFEAQGQIILFNGWWKVAGRAREEIVLPKLTEGDQVKDDTFCATEHQTLPPSRYTEASLIAALEREGIGRPSTYAPIISTILERQYVEKTDGKLGPTELGTATNDFLVENFPDIMSLPFTAEMEDGLDKVANGEKKWVPILQEFWEPFNKRLENATETAKRVKIKFEKTGEKCPKCKTGEQVVRIGRFGKFLSCSRFPDCDWTQQFVEKIGMSCPECHEGEVILRKTRKGRQFYGCSRYPKCRWASWKKPFGNAQDKPFDSAQDKPADSEGGPQV